HAAPHVRNFARQKNTFTGTEVESFVAHVKFKLAFNDVDPLILIVMQMGRAAAGARELENAQRASGVLARYLAIVGFAAGPPDLDVLFESFFSGADGEAEKLSLGLLLLSSFQVRDGFINRPQEAACARELLFEALPMGLEGSDPLEIGPAQDLLDLFQLQP